MNEKSIKLYSDNDSEFRVKEQLVLSEGEIISVPVKAAPLGETEKSVVNVYDIPRHKIRGFGGAFTEAAAYTYARMTDDDKKRALELLFGKSGLNYNFCRLAIGSCDFSIGEYSEVSDGDETLESFSIERDKKYIIPFVKDALAFTGQKIELFASPWSPPKYMKDSGSLRGGKLKKEYYPLYAEYFAKFIESYAAEGIKISAVTMQNEPHSHTSWEGCYFDGGDEAEFCVILHDTFARHGLDVRIFCWDHNKERLVDRAEEVFSAAGTAAHGIAFHWYSGEHYEAIRLVKALFPDKEIIESEFCRGVSEKGYMKYRDDILENLEAGTSAIVDWNLILDEQGGPYHNRNFGCRGELFYDTVKKELRTHGFYNEMYLFSHYIKKGASVLGSTSFRNDIKVLGVKNPDGEVLVYINNRGTAKTQFTLRYLNHEYPLNVENASVVLLRISA